MTPEFQLILGCSLLGSVVAYAWWTRLRVPYFQMDLIKIADELLARDSAETRHPTRTVLAEAIMIFVRHPDLVSPSGLLALYRTIEPGKPAKIPAFTASMTMLIRSHLSDRDHPEEIESALMSLIDRFSRFLFRETVSGWVYLIYLLASGRWKTTLSRLIQAIRLIPNPWELHRLDVLISPDVPRT